MLMDLVSNNHSDQMSNSGEKKVCMKRFLILSSSTGNTETVFEMVDRFLDIDSDFVGFILFFRTAFNTRIRTKIFFRIDVDHPSARRSRAGIVTVADTPFGFVGRIVFPFHFGAYKFHGRDLAF